MSSLHRRVALGAALVLAGFVFAAGFALEEAFRESARAARAERLLGLVYVLMEAAEDEPEGLTFPQDIAEARFSLPDSGLYGEITDADGAVLWRSRSSVGLQPPFRARLAPGTQRFEVLTDPAGTRYFVHSYGVRWATGPEARDLTFSVAEDTREFDVLVNRHRATLYGWLAVLAIALLALLWAVLRWGLQPLRRVAAEVAAVQSGAQDRLAGRYPQELRLLTENINVLLAREGARRARLGNALADLAHSLKTPLAVVHGLLADANIDRSARSAVEEQLQRMRRIVDYHLQRARSGHGGAARAAVTIGPAVQRVAASLAKVYRDKPVAVEAVVPGDAAFRGDEDDLLELLGNLLDNAFKWCRGRVRVTVAREGDRTTLAVEDDGPGIDPERGRELLRRGVRADESVPGHGIGLAVVRDIVAAYGGEVAIGRATLGGAKVVVQLRA
jgi:two-component system sensor histidine kinase PhoQ